MSNTENKNWKELVLKEADEGVSQKRKIRMPKAEAEKFKAQQQAQLQPQQTKKDDSSNPLSIGNIATGIGLQYGINKLMSKGGEEAAAEAGKEVAKKAASARRIGFSIEAEETTPKGNVFKQIFSKISENPTAQKTFNIGKESWSFLNKPVSFAKTGADAAAAGVEATAAGAEATAAGVEVTAAGAEAGASTTIAGGTLGGAAAIAGAVVAGAAIGSVAGYLINKGVSSLGKSYDEIVKETLTKAQQNKNYLISELNGYKSGGYKYELGSEENEKSYGLGFSTKGQRVKTGVLGFGNEVRTPGSYDAKDGPIIIGLLSILFNNEKAEGKITETDEKINGETIKLIDISRSSLMNYRQLLNIFGYIDKTTKDFKLNNVMISKIPQELRMFIFNLLLAYEIADIQKSGVEKMQESRLKKDISKELRKFILEQLIQGNTDPVPPVTTQPAPKPVANTQTVDTAPTFEQWLKDNKAEVLWNQMWEGVEEKNREVPKFYSKEQKLIDMKVLISNLDQVYVKDTQIATAYATLLNTRRTYGLSAVRELSDSYEGETGTGKGGEISALYNEIDDIDTTSAWDDAFGVTSFGGSAEGGKKTEMLKMINMAHDIQPNGVKAPPPGYLAIEKKQIEYSKKQQTSQEEKQFSVGKIVVFDKTGQLYKIIAVNQDGTIDVADPIKNRKLGEKEKTDEYSIYNPKFNVGQKIKFIGNNQLYKVTVVNSDGTINVSAPDNNTELGKNENPKEYLLVKESKNMNLKNKILKELKFLINEAPLDSGVSVSGGAAGATAGATAGAAPAAAGAAPAGGFDVKQARARRKEKALLNVNLGVSPETPFASKNDADSFLNLDAEKVSNKLTNNDQLDEEKPIYYIDSGRLFKGTIDVDNSGKYTMTPAEVPQGYKYLKGYTPAKPFDSINEALASAIAASPGRTPATFKDINRASKVIYYKTSNGALGALSYDNTGTPINIVAGSKVKYKGKPEWGTYTVTEVNQESGTITIVGAKDKKTGKQTPQSGEKIEEYTDSSTPITLSESKNIYKAILKEIKHILNEAPNQPGEGATASPQGGPVAGASAAPAAAKTYTPEQRAQQKKIADDIRVKLGLPAAPAGVGLDKALQDKINALRASNPDFPKRSGDLTAGLANIQKWVVDPKNAAAVKGTTAPSAEEKSLPQNCPPSGNGNKDCPFNSYQSAALYMNQNSEKFKGPSGLKSVYFKQNNQLRVLPFDIATQKASDLNDTTVVMDSPSTKTIKSLEESWSIRNKNKYAQNLFERLINDVPKKGKR